MDAGSGSRMKSEVRNSSEAGTGVQSSIKREQGGMNIHQINRIHLLIL